VWIVIVWYMDYGWANGGEVDTP